MTKYTILSFDLSTSGIRITYKANEEIKVLDTHILGACYLLKHAGYIKRHRYKGDVLCILLDITEDSVTPQGDLITSLAGAIEITWEFFTRNYDLDDEWCLEIIALHEMHDKIFAA